MSRFYFQRQRLLIFDKRLSAKTIKKCMHIILAEVCRFYLTLAAKLNNVPETTTEAHSPLGVNEVVNFTPRGQISLLGARGKL
jgi:hypothetical protein